MDEGEDGEEMEGGWDGSPKTVMHEETRHAGLEGLGEDLRAWRAATAGLRGGWEGVEGEVSPVEEGMLGEEWWERMGGYLREGLAEEVRMTDAFGREVRGDGSLVEGEGSRIG